MLVHSVNPILNVADVPASIEWFERLGWKRAFTWNENGMIPGAALRDAHGPAHFGSVCAFDDSRPEAQNHHAPAIFLCKDGQGKRDHGPLAPPLDPSAADFGSVWMSWWVENVDAAHEECKKAKVEIVRPPVNEPWGVREFLIRHPDGHCFRVSGHVK